MFSACKIIIMIRKLYAKNDQSSARRVSLSFDIHSRKMVISPNMHPRKQMNMRMRYFMGPAHG